MIRVVGKNIRLRNTVGVDVVRRRIRSRQAANLETFVEPVMRACLLCHYGMSPV